MSFKSKRTEKVVIYLNEETTKPQQRIELLWIDISNLSHNLQFFLCSILVLLFFLLYGYLQELMFSSDGFKSLGWYLTLLQFSLYSAFAWIELKVMKSSRRIPMKIFFLLAFLTLGTMGLSNSSLGYLNYPTQVIFKCCKLIPVMIGGTIIQKKQYAFPDFLAAGLMSAGLILFTLADSHISPNFHFLGIAMICSALACDAAIGNFQEKAMKMYESSNAEIVFYSYFLGFCYLFFILLCTGDLVTGFLYFQQHPIAYLYVLLFSSSGYLGIQIVLTLIRISGALVAVTVTTFRKVISIIISFLLFQKPFTSGYVWAGLLIVAGVYVNVLSKNKVQIDQNTIKKCCLLLKCSQKRKLPVQIA